MWIAMKPTMSNVAATLLLLCAVASINFSFCKGSSNVGCIESERQALLKFKQDLDDRWNRLASWTGDRDCCTWAGVVCDNLTGHVYKLNLRIPFDGYAYGWSMLVGKLNPSLIDLKHLAYLDLSGNYFAAIQFPRFLGSMRSLRYLNLSQTGFVGMIPLQLGNLSYLQYLDLRPYYRGNLYVENCLWLSGLSFLKHLDLSAVDLSRTSDLLLVTNTLPSLEVLQLSCCQIHHFAPLPIVNFSSLTSLDLSYNLFDTSFIPNWVFGLSRLVFLNLGYTNLQGPIPDGLQNLTALRHLQLSDNHFNSSIPNWLYGLNHLEFLCLKNNSLEDRISGALGNLTSISWLDLSYNRLEGRIPRSWGKLCNLRSFFLAGTKLSQELSEILDFFSGCVSDRLETMALYDNQLFGHLSDQLVQFKSLDTLHLSDNSISGSIPSSLGKLSTLRRLDLGNNKMNGTLSQIHFVNLTKLLFFYVSGNSLRLEMGPNWIPPFQLQVLGLRSCHLGSQFPLWLHSQKFLYYLDISNTNILDNFPSRFCKSLLQPLFLNLSHNQIQGKVPNLSDAPQLVILDLSSNNLSGPLPQMSAYLKALDLSNNAVSGSISHFLCYRMNESKSLLLLNLANNLLSEELPDCWMNWQSLMVLNLANNKFVGNLPKSMGALSYLQSLHLRKNNFSGKMPESLKNCTKLVAVDISENEFVGNIPTWIGERFSRIMILNLHSNKFNGVLPIELCRLASLQILDLAHNNLSGVIPRCIKKFSAMVTMSYFGGTYIQYMPYFYYPGSMRNFETNYLEDALLVMKGKAAEYKTILNLVRNIDLSRNNFSGDIPSELTNLVALISLNLSHNSFTGRIPESIGAMRSLLSLDFSANQLSGEIPKSISSLTFLSHLNLSGNNLIGKIPSCTQLETMDASCFTGNELCGSPLPNPCSVPTLAHGNGNGDDKEHEVDWFYVSMAPGFVVGFWSVIGPLLINKRWRYKYCNFLDFLGDKFGSVVRKVY